MDTQRKPLVREDSHPCHDRNCLKSKFAGATKGPVGVIHLLPQPQDTVPRVTGPVLGTRVVPFKGMHLSGEGMHLDSLSHHNKNLE